MLQLNWKVRKTLIIEFQFKLRILDSPEIFVIDTSNQMVLIEDTVVLV